jgi:alkylation response protein AidB-like acyl-CoA dehydrogenase
LAYTDARDRLGELSMRALGRGAFDVHDERVEERLRTLSMPIAAGTSQIQRNIISERLLGMPKEKPWPSE